MVCLRFIPVCEVILQFQYVINCSVLAQIININSHQVAIESSNMELLKFEIEWSIRISESFEKKCVCVYLYEFFHIHIYFWF